MCHKYHSFFSHMTIPYATFCNSWRDLSLYRDTSWMISCIFSRIIDGCFLPVRMDKARDRKLVGWRHMTGVWRQQEWQKLVLPRGCSVWCFGISSHAGAGQQNSGLCIAASCWGDSLQRRGPEVPQGMPEQGRDDYVAKKGKVHVQGLGKNL